MNLHDSVIVVAGDEIGYGLIAEKDGELYKLSTEDSIKPTTWYTAECLFAVTEENRKVVSRLANLLRAKELITETIKDLKTELKR